MSQTKFSRKQKVALEFMVQCIACGKNLPPRNAPKDQDFCECGLGQEVRGRINRKVIPSEAVSGPLNYAGILPTSAVRHKLTTREIFEELGLADQYEVLDQVGEGGMGTVYKVRDKAIGKLFAVKVLRTDVATERFARKRFEQEAIAASKLTHPNLVAVYSNGLACGETPYLVMDYIEGENLADVLKREVYLSIDRTLDIVHQISEALVHAHAKGIVHRDLKPSNIILTKTFDGHDMIKIVDFGIAKLMPSVSKQTNNFTQTGDLCGSPSYMSPEQCKDEALDERSDIYSLGCVMYELLTGRTPFESSNPIKVILAHLSDRPKSLMLEYPDRHFSSHISRVVSACLEKDPNQRYQSAKSLMKDIEALRSNEPLKQCPAGNLNVPMTVRVKAGIVDSMVVGTLSGVVSLPFVINAVLSSQSLAVGPSLWGTVYVNTALGVAATLFEFWSSWLLFILCPFISPPATVPMTLAAILGLVMLPIWIYRAGFLSSKFQATPGMMLYGLRMTDDKGAGLTFVAASKYHFFHTLSSLLITIVEYFRNSCKHPNFEQTWLERATDVRLERHQTSFLKQIGSK